MTAVATQKTRGAFSERLAGIFHKRTFADTAPRLSEPKRFPYGQFQFQISLSAEQAYEVETSTDLRHWGPLFKETARRETTEFLDTTAANFSHRYYRVRSGELYSTNVIGYVKLSIPPGFSMIANPLLGATNTVETLFPRVPEGTTLTKFETHLFKLTKNEFTDGKWSNPGDTLLPGEGAIIFNPTGDFKSLGLVGEVQQGEISVPIPAGFSVRSSVVPVPGQLDSDLDFPVANEDVVHLYDRDRQKYTVYEFNGGKWSPEPPVLAVGESFWVGKTNAGNWNRTLVLNQAEVEEQPEVAVA